MTFSPYKRIKNIFAPFTGWSKSYNDDAPNNDAKVAIVNKYLDSVMLNEKFPGSEGAKNYLSKRIQAIDDLKGITLPDGSELTKKLATDTEAVKAIRESLTGCFALNDATRTAMDKFKADMAREAKEIKERTPRKKPSEIIGNMYKIKSAARAAILKQQDLELNNLKEKFDNPDFKRSLNENLGIKTDEESETLKDDMLSTLKASHEKELKKFETTMDIPLNNLLTGLSLEVERINALGNQLNHKEMLKEIQRLKDAKNDLPEGAMASMTLSDTNDSALLEGINIDDFKKFYSATGRVIDHNKEDGSFRITLPNHFFRPDYYSDPNNNTKKDIASIVEKIKAQGHTAITISIEHKTPEHALELARESYEAALEAGFEPQNINIHMNGKKMTQDDLFKDCRERYQISSDKAMKNKADKETTVESVFGLNEYKDEIEKTRSNARAAEAEEKPKTTAPRPKS